MHKIYLENFEGPLDLLLYFIRRDKIDIYDIPISKITKEYMITLDKMKKLNVTVAGDFIDMAATLMRIKAKILLPSQRNGSEESVEDPRTALVQQLLVYQQFKIAAEQLSNLAQQQNHYFPRQIKIDINGDDKRSELQIQNISLFDVAWHFKTALENMPVITQYELQKENINLESQITKIMSWFDGDGILLFSSLMKRLIHKVEIIVSFLAVLELIQQGIIQVLQNEIFGEIEFHYLGNKA